MKTFKIIPSLTLPIEPIGSSGEAFVTGGCFNMKEIWKHILEADNRYSVSNYGNVKNNNTCKLRKKSLTKRGYYSIMFSFKNKFKFIPVHRLVALAFIPNPENKICVNHIDGNKLNNNVNNLEWATHSENNQHAYDIGIKIGYWTGKFGNEHPKYKSKLD